MPDQDPSTENRVKAQAALTHLDALTASPSFAWFMREVLERKRDECRNAALNVELPPEERDRACWCHQLADQFCDAPKRLRELYGRTMG